MSRIGKAPIKMVSGVKVNLTGATLKVEGPKGKLQHQIPEGVRVDIGTDEIKVLAIDESRQESVALQGTTRSVIQNLIIGCSQEFKKELDITGVGYRAAAKGRVLNLTLGFSHPVEFQLPEGIAAKVEKNTHLTLSGADKVVLGRVAAKIRELRPPEPYQGKGIRYSDERILRKQGKTAGAGK